MRGSRADATEEGMIAAGMPAGQGPGPGSAQATEPIAPERPEAGAWVRVPAVRPRGWQLWLGFFGYAAGVVLCVQLIILPYLLPDLHAGHGLFVGQDSVTYHRIATDQAERIRAEGWSAWTLRPRGHATAGIASAIYAISIPEPWTAIPLNALLYATAGLVLLCIVEMFSNDRRVALCAVVPFLLYPSAISWYSQLLKEGWFILGGLLFAYGWLGLARLDTWTRGVCRPIGFSTWIIFGALLVWVVRPYSAFIMQALAMLLALLLMGVFVRRGVEITLPWRKAVSATVLAWAMVGGVTVFTYLQPTAPAPEVPEEVLTGGPAPQVTVRWHASPWLPRFIDRRFEEVALVRDLFRLGYPEAGTNIDTDVEFRSALDVFAYLPRATVIALFAPFPEQWVEEGVTEGGTLMRRVAAFEMVGLYIALALLPYAVWRWRRRVEVYVAAIYSMGVMVIFSTAITNVGILYRLRYGFMMILAALGIAGVLAARGRSSSTGTIPPSR